MAKYVNIFRSSYFRVKDEDKWKDLWENHVDGEDLEDFSYKDDDGNRWHGFGGSGTYGYFNSRDALEYGDEMLDLDDFLDKIAELIIQGDACVIYDVGYEKLRYISGSTIVVTTGEVQYSNLADVSHNMMRAVGVDPKTVREEY